MKIIRNLSLRFLQKNRFRTTMTVLSILLSAALFTATVTTVYSLWSFLVRGYVYETGRYLVSFEGATANQAEEAFSDPEVKEGTALAVLGYTSLAEHGTESIWNTFELDATGEDFFEQMSVPLTEGRYPENSSEILLPKAWKSVCENNGLTAPDPGDKLVLPCYCPDVPMTVSDPVSLPEVFSEKQFTVVGYMENRSYREQSSYYVLLTAGDSGADPLWLRLFLNCSPNEADSLSTRSWGLLSEKNEALLEVYGQTGYSNVNSTVVLLILLLLLIIMAISISIIRNVFTVSVSERTHDFGLLVSIGASKKQLKDLVRNEALYLTAAGVPAGLVLGYGMSALLLSFFGHYLERLFSFGIRGAVLLRACFAWPVMLAAILISVLSICISIIGPVRKVSRIVPIEAVRNADRYRNHEKQKQRISKRSNPVRGAARLLGKRYYQAGRVRFRTSVAALSFSFIIFIASSGFFSELRLASKVLNTNTEAHDFVISYYSENDLERSALYEEIRAAYGVKASAVTKIVDYETVLPRRIVDEKYEALLVQEGMYADQNGEYCRQQFVVFYMDDRALEALLKAEGIDPEAYLHGEDALAAAIPQSVSFFVPSPADPVKRDLVSYYGYILPENAGSFFGCVGLSLPEELRDGANRPAGGSGTNPAPGKYPNTTLDRDGNTLIEASEDTYYLVRFRADPESGKTVASFHLIDPDTGKAAEAAAAEQELLAGQTISVGARLKEIPLGVPASQSSKKAIGLILPLSKMPEGLSSSADLYIKTDQVELLRAELEAFQKSEPNMEIWDLHDGEVNQRGMIGLLNVFSGGFILLVFLIACSNVFSTAYTGMMMKRRDFGMLRSIGFQKKDLYRMITYEHLRYSLAVILISLPIGIMLCYGIHRIYLSVIRSAFVLPWKVILLGTGLIISTMFLSALYGLHLLKRATPIEAIREENV